MKQTPTAVNEVFLRLPLIHFMTEDDGEVWVYVLTMEAQAHMVWACKESPGYDARTHHTSTNGD
jgi:hypothetical protein